MSVDSANPASSHSGTGRKRKPEFVNPKSEKIRQYLIERNVDIYVELDQMREKVWNSEEASKHFEKQREKADTQELRIQVGFLQLMLQVAKEIQERTGIFTSVRHKNPRSVLAKPIRALDTCMAPGAFSSFFLTQNPRSTLDGLSLPTDLGGHKLLLENAIELQQKGRKTVDTAPARADVAFTDVTLHPVYLPPGKSLPEDFPDKAAFSSNPPLLPALQTLPTHPSERRYEFVIADGAYLRTHAHAQLRPWEAARLRISQLILGLSFIKPGGSMLILLHHLENWFTFATIYNFSRFAQVDLYKPSRAHMFRSSFYLMVTGVRPEEEVCRKWVGELREAWYAMTFGGEEGLGGMVEMGEGMDVDEMLRVWGEEFVRKGDNVWRTQRDAMKRQGWAE